MRHGDYFSLSGLASISKAKGLGLYVPVKGATCSFPAIYKDGEAGKINGELYKILNEKDGLELLDLVEGVPDLYTREIVEVNIKGKKVNAYTYIANFNPMEWGMALGETFVPLKTRRRR